MKQLNRTASMRPQCRRITTEQGAYRITLRRPNDKSDVSSNDKSDVSSIVTEGLQAPTLMMRLLGRGETTEERHQKQAMAINNLVYLLIDEQDHNQELHEIEANTGKSALAIIDDFFKYPNGIPPCYLEDDSRSLNFEGESLHATLKEAEENGDDRFAFIRSQLATRSRASQHRLVRTLSGNEATLLLPEDGGENLGIGSSGFVASAQYYPSTGAEKEDVAYKIQPHDYKTRYARQQHQRQQNAQYNAAQILYKNGFHNDKNVMRVHGKAECVIDDMDAIILEKCDHLPLRKTQQELISGVKQTTALMKRLLDKNIRQNDFAMRNLMRKGKDVKLIDPDYTTQATKEQEELLGLTDYPKLFDEELINYKLENMQELDNDTTTTKAKTRFFKPRLKGRKETSSDKAQREEKRLEHKCRKEFFTHTLQSEENNMFVDNIVKFIQEETKKINVSHANNILGIYDACIDIQRQETKLRRVHATLQYLNILPSQELGRNDINLMRHDLQDVYLGEKTEYPQETPKERLEAYARTLAQDIKTKFNSLCEDISQWPDDIEEENASGCVIS